MKKGFTLIELMIVVAIIAIIAAIAIPSLMASRIQANESNAIAAVKAYATAQVTFQKSGFGIISTNASEVTGADTAQQRKTLFCRPYTELYDGSNGTAGSRIELINAAMAAAVYAADGGIAYQGYIFEEDGALDDTAATWSSRYGILAYPNGYATSGYNIYWVGIQGVVQQQNVTGTSGETPSTVGDATPNNATPSGDWITT